MKRRIFAAALAAALILLSACGGGKGASSSSQSSSGQSSSSQSSGSQSAPDGSEEEQGLLLPDSSNPDPSQVPDASLPDGSADQTQEPVAQSSLSLSKSDFTLFKSGATWQLKAKAEPAGGKQTWSSSDEKVATVDDKGVVTAVGNGSATITVTDENTGLSASCAVRVRIEEQKPESGGSSSGGSSSGDSSSSGSQSSKVDLSAFYATLSAGENFPMMMQLTGDTLNNMYPGLSDISTKQQVVYAAAISAVACEIAMVEVSNSSDVQAVKDVFQARIDSQLNGGVLYPSTLEAWENAQIVTHGNYVGLFVSGEGLDNYASQFSALF